MQASEPQIVYVQRSDATPEVELGALAAVYRFVVLDRQEREKATRPGGPDDEREDKNALARNIIPK
jgi:hypothetical protein